ncbi:MULTISPECIES: hypothetical protein [Flavobacterium]|uniref:hypothetical protein n=1 Tax=Flavobacterium TaxID=237 RepID=UPI001FCAB997|nr:MULTISPECIES: hypothetical protein [Flavobacterium]UOK43161.1 hypothetical protein LZF87_03330 [Flavobacterium enshiense]
MKKIFLLLVVSVLSFSCGKKEANEQKEVQEEQEVVVNPNTFKVEVEGIFKKDDELILFWKDPSISYFDDKHTIYQGIKGSDSPQKIVFEFNEGEIPNDIRFDVSSKKEQNEIMLNYIKLEQQDRSFVIGKDKISHYFRTNEFAQLDSLSGKIVTKEINQAYDPILFTNPQIYPEMERVLKTQF